MIKGESKQYGEHAYHKNKIAEQHEELPEGKNEANKQEKRQSSLGFEANLGFLIFLIQSVRLSMIEGYFTPPLVFIHTATSWAMINFNPQNIYQIDSEKFILYYQQKNTYQFGGKQHANFIICMHFQPAQILNAYNQLQANDQTSKMQANHYFEQLLASDTAYSAAKDMILQLKEPNHKLLGASLLHRKLLRSIQTLTTEARIQLRDFLLASFDRIPLSDSAVKVQAQSLALITISIYPNEWPTFLQNIKHFMSKSQPCFKSVLSLLQDLPNMLSKEALSRQQRINCLKSLSQQSSEVVDIFLGILQIEQSMVQDSIIEIIKNWSSTSFPTLTHTPLIQHITDLTLSQGNLNQSCLQIINNALLKAYLTKSQTLDLNIETTFNKHDYNEQEIKSVQIIVEFLVREQTDLFNTFEEQNNNDSIHHLIDITKLLLINYGFNNMEPFKKELLNFAKNMLAQTELKLSLASLTFWKNYLKYLNQLPESCIVALAVNDINMDVLDILVPKVTMDERYLDPNFKEADETIEENPTVTLRQYRQEAQELLKIIHDFCLKEDPDIGPEIFFSKISNHVAKVDRTVFIELSIFVMESSFNRTEKSPIETAKALSLIRDVFASMNENKADYLPSPVKAKFISLIALYSPQIAEDHLLYHQCIRYILSHLQNEQINIYTVRAYESLMKRAKPKDEYEIMQTLIPTYFNLTFSDFEFQTTILKQICTAVTRNPQYSQILSFFRMFTLKVTEKVKLLTEQINISHYNPVASLNTLIEIKVLIDFFKEPPQEFEKEYYQYIANLIELGITINHQNIVELGSNLTQENQAYFELTNELTAKIAAANSILPYPLINTKIHIETLNLIHPIFQFQYLPHISDWIPLLHLAFSILFFFKSHPNQFEEIDHWVTTFLQKIQFYLRTYIEQHCGSTISKIDPDVIRSFYTVQYSLVIYNSSIFETQEDLSFVLNFAINILNQITEPDLQATLLHFLNQCLLFSDLLNDRKHQILGRALILVPILPQDTLYKVAHLLCTIFQQKSKKDIQFQLKAVFLKDDTFNYLPKTMLDVALKYLPLFIRRQEYTYIKGILTHIQQMHNNEQARYQVNKFQLLYKSWVSQIGK